MVYVILSFGIIMLFAFLTLFVICDIDDRRCEKEILATIRRIIIDSNSMNTWVITANIQSKIHQAKKEGMLFIKFDFFEDCLLYEPMQLGYDIPIIMSKVITNLTDNGYDVHNIDYCTIRVSWS